MSKPFKLSTGKDGKEEYVSQFVINKIRDLEGEITNSVFKIKIYSNFDKESFEILEGSIGDLVNELLIRNLTFGFCRYEILDIERRQ